MTPTPRSQHTAPTTRRAAGRSTACSTAIPELLADLRAAGVRLAVATSKAEPTARRILEHFGLDEHFDVIAGASVDGVRATKSEVVAHALAQLAPLPERVVMVGDRAHDVEGAAAHGIGTVVVDWGYGTADFAEPMPRRPCRACGDRRRAARGARCLSPASEVPRRRGRSGV